MAKGSIAKEQILQKIMEVFPDAFMYEKTLYIPMMEDGAEVQIKCALTCAKTNVERDGANDFPSAATAPVTPEPGVIAPTADEKEAVVNLLKSLGL